MAWIVTAFAHSVQPISGFPWITISLAGAFSLLFLAHGLAFAKRAGAFQRAMAFNSVGYDAAEPYVESWRVYFVGLSGLISLLIGPIMAVVSSGRPLGEKSPGDDCIKDDKGGSVKCIKTDCLPLFDKNGKKYTGQCKLIEKSRGKKPTSWECLCIYDVKSECTMNKKEECDGECPDLFLTDPTKDKKAAAVDKQCDMIAEREKDEVKFRCICLYW